MDCTDNLPASPASQPVEPSVLATNLTYDPGPHDRADEPVVVTAACQSSANHGGQRREDGETWQRGTFTL